MPTAGIEKKRVQASMSIARQQALDARSRCRRSCENFDCRMGFWGSRRGYCCRGSFSHQTFHTNDSCFSETSRYTDAIDPATVLSLQWTRCGSDSTLSILLTYRSPDYLEVGATHPTSTAPMNTDPWHALRLPHPHILPT